MPLWGLALIVCAAGFLGGILISITTTKNPWPTDLGDTTRDPGYVGNAIIGAAAAVVSWGLYGPFSSFAIIGPQPSSQTPSDQFSLTLASLVGALLVGMGGVKWISAEIDKTLEKETNSKLMLAPQLQANDVAALVKLTPRQRHKKVDDLLKQPKASVVSD